MAYKRNGAAQDGHGHVNEGADVIEHADGPSANKPGTAGAAANPSSVHEYAFKHPFGNVMLGEDHDQVDTFQMSYLLMAMAVLGFVVLVSVAIVILAEIDLLQRAGSSSGHSTSSTSSEHVAA